MIPQEDIMCIGSPGICKEQTACVADYDVKEYIEPANSYIMNLAVKADDETTDDCKTFGVEAVRENENLPLQLLLFLLFFFSLPSLLLRSLPPFFLLKKIKKIKSTSSTNTSATARRRRLLPRPIPRRRRP